MLDLHGQSSFISDKALLPQRSITLSAKYLFQCMLTLYLCQEMRYMYITFLSYFTCLKYQILVSDIYYYALSIRLWIMSICMERMRHQVAWVT